MREKLISKGREDFYAYCRLTAPDFYTLSRLYLKEICTSLQDLYYTPNGRLGIHVPPRHGKTRTIIQFVSWILGKDPSNKAFVCTYNEKYSSTIGRGVRDLIGTKGSGGGEFFCYKEFFPDTKVNRANSSKVMWSLEGQHFNFLSTSPKGTATGNGCNFLIIDDIIKDHMEAMNNAHKEALWDWYVMTLQSRMQKGCRIIVVNTRWATDDIGGRLYASEPGMWKHLVYPIYNEETDEMLCEDIKGKDEFFRHMDKSKLNQHAWAIFRANYFQEPVSFTMSNIFSSIQTYETIPKFERLIGYIDVANGGDYLCFILAGLTSDNLLYVLDVLYTQDKIEITVPTITKMLYRNLAKKGIYCNLQIETNGAIGFYNLLEKEIIEKGLDVVVEAKHNRESKVARINNALLSANIYYLFPKDAYLRWEKFYTDLISYNPKGRNKHDDGPDAMAGLLKYFMDNFLAEHDNFGGWS